MEIDFPQYSLTSQLRGHEDDVRGICVCGDVGIATSSSDRTIRFWTLNQSNNHDYVLSKILPGHSSFVMPLAWISPSEEFPEGRIVSGGIDRLVFVWNLVNAEKCQTLKGHQQQVTGIVLDGLDIISSSADCTLRRWRGGQQVEVWEAHNAAIQAVMKLPSGELITGSSDTTVKLWNGKTCLHTFSGHTDTVRSLAAMPGLGFLSASHDGSIRLWALSGEVLLEMVGHTSIVYSVDAHVSGLIVSGSEDGFAKIWKDGVCLQSIEHPGCVWDAKFLGNGDIVTACSDGIVRVWTVHHDRTADPQEAELYASLLSEYRKKIGVLKLNDLPGLEALQTPGTKDEQKKVVREGEYGVAYVWNMIESKWDKIGKIVDEHGPDDSMKRPVLNRKEYDYVFDVDIGDGEPIRKLSNNRSDSTLITKNEVDAEWCWSFGMALNRHDWEKLKNLISSLRNEKELLNAALCFSAIGLWYLRTEEQIDALHTLIVELIERGATDIEDALHESLTTIICLSAHLCNQRIYNNVTTATLLSTVLETEKWTEYRCEQSPENSNNSVQAARYMTRVMYKGIDLYEPADKNEEDPYDLLQEPTNHQIVGFTNFLTVVANYLLPEWLTEAFLMVFDFLVIFSDSLDPGWASKIQGTGIPQVLILMANRISEEGARIMNKKFLEASGMGHCEVVDIMLQVVDPVIPLDSHLGLICACHGDEPDSVERLLDHGVTNFGREPLKEAASRGHLEIVQMLINKGCKSEEVYEALDVALQYNQREVVEYIRFYLFSSMQ